MTSAVNQLAAIEEGLMRGDAVGDEAIRKLGNTANTLAAIDMNASVIHGFLLALMTTYEPGNGANRIDRQRTAFRALLADQRAKALNLMKRIQSR